MVAIFTSPLIVPAFHTCDSQVLLVLKPIAAPSPVMTPPTWLSMMPLLPSMTAVPDAVIRPVLANLPLPNTNPALAPTILPLLVAAPQHDMDRTNAIPLLDWIVPLLVKPVSA